MIRLPRLGRWILGVGVAALVGSVGLAQIVIQGNVQIQPQQLPGGKDEEPKKDGQKSSQFSAVKLIENADYRRYINVARDAIKDKEWGVASRALQEILDTKEDFYVQVRDKDNAGREVTRWTSVKFEAQNLLGSMPDEGLAVYEVSYGGKALAMLKEAKDTGNRELLAEVVNRYFHTVAGVEGNDLLATSMLDRGQYFLAALRYERSMKLSATRFKANDLTLFKAALSYRRAGETKKAADIWQKLEDRLQDRGLKVGDQVIELAKLRTVYADEKAPLPVGMFDWPMVRGDLKNNAQATGSPPLLERPYWRRLMLLDDDPNAFNRFEDFEKPVKERLDTLLNNPNNPIAMPGFFPITTDGKLVFRSYGELRCVALADDAANSVKAGDTLWRTGNDMKGSLNQLLKQKEPEHNLSDVVTPWLDKYLNLPGAPGFANFLFENTTIGAISTDHQYVYAIDDLAIPAPDNLLQPGPMWQFQGMPPPVIPAKIRPLLMQNTLSAYSVRDGLAKWELGSFNPKDPKDDFTDSHFLGAPISVGGRLYVLNEKSQGQQGDAELRLVCINPNVVGPGSKPQIVQPIQVLGNVEQRNRVTHAISRRVNAVHLAYGEGILVCPTNAGEVLGVDLISRSLAWAYPYRERAPAEAHSNNDNQNFNPRFGRAFPMGSTLASATVTLTKWKSTPPAVVDGKIVFTAPDADSVHCINLHDGTPRWKVGRLDGDLYFAGVVGKKVLIVGKNHVRALNLDDGRQVWSLTTGDVPSGQGVASNGVFYQPLKKGEILAVDVERGHVKAHNRSKDSNDKVGNLVFSDGAVISLTPYEVKAFPQLLAKLEIADAAVKNDPLNGEKLVNRGEILLADGQVQKAVNDLQTALKQKLPEALEMRAKAHLYEALTDLLLVDFNGASTKYLDEYREICKLGANDQEKQARQAKFFRIVGNGRETQGNLIDAFQMYKDFGSLPIIREGGVASLEDPSHKVPVDVWLRGRVSAMFAKATPEQRAPLEAKIADEWKAVDAKKDVDAIRAFVGMFDVAFAVGREARLRLAEELLDRNDRANFLEAELNLYQLRGQEYRKQPASGGKALAGLAQLEEKRGSAEAMQAASGFYRQLASEFPSDVVRQGKTGKDLFNDLAADKRLLPFLEDSSSFWNEAPISARELGGIGGFSSPQQMQQFQHNVLHPEGETTPFLRRHRLTLETNINMGGQPKLTLTDLSTGKNRWGPLPLPGYPGNLHIAQIYQPQQFNQPANPNARFRFYQSVGRLAIVQVGVMVYCLDADQGKVLWQQPLIEGLGANPMINSQLILDGEGNVELLTYNNNNNQQSRKAVGQIGAVHANYVALVGSQGLQVIDPLRGNVLWKKNDIPAGSRIFGDDQYIFAVEMGEGGATGITRVLRASDGEPLAVANFMPEYQNRKHVFGRRILVSERNQVLRLYDIVAGKDVWTKTHDPDATLLTTENPNLCGWITKQGRLVALDTQTGAELMNTSVMQGRIGLDDVQNLREPLLLADADRMYLALNHPIDNKVGGGVLSNNFQSGIRGRFVNGFVLAFHRNNGPVKVGRKTVEAAKGELAWHSDRPIENQMLVTEQFDQMPILLLTSRHHRMMPNGSAPGTTSTIALHKQTGKVPYDSGARPTYNNFFPQFVNLQADSRQGTINLIGHSATIQFYVDDGRKVDPPIGVNATTTQANPGNMPVAPGVAPVPVFRPRPVRVMPAPVPVDP